MLDDDEMGAYQKIRERNWVEQVHFKGVPDFFFNI